MALSAKVGTFAVGVNLNDTVTVTTGFQPTCIFPWWSGTLSAVDAVGRAQIRRGFGFASSVSNRFFLGSFSQDAVATSVTNRLYRSDSCIGNSTSGDLVDGLADLDAILSTGFRIITDDAFSDAIQISYLALGGDLTNAAAVFTDSPTVIGTQDITGFGFDPDMVLFISPSAAGNPPVLTAHGSLSLGFANSTSAEFAFALASEDGRPAMDTWGYAFSGECSAALTANTGAVANRAEFTTFIADGVRINWLEASFTSELFVIGLKGAQTAVGTFLTQTTTGGTVTVSGLAFQPRAVLLISHCRAADTQDTATSNDRMSIGAFTSTTERVAQATFDTDAAADADCNIGIEYDEAYQNLSPTDGANDGLMDVDAVLSDGFRMIMDDGDPAQAIVGYLAFGDAAAPAAGQPFYIRDSYTMPDFLGNMQS